MTIRIGPDPQSRLRQHHSPVSRDTVKFYDSEDSEGVEADTDHDDADSPRVLSRPTTMCVWGGGVGVG